MAKGGKSKEEAKPPVNGAAPDVQGMPLFFKQPRLLDAKNHAKAHVRPSLDYAFARSTNSIMINAIEFLEAVRYYPIVFTAGDVPMPAAVVGLEQENYFIDSKGQWRADYYIPAYARQYPFIFFEREEDNKFYLCIDEASPQYSAAHVDGGEPLYVDGDKPSALTQNALQFCTSFYNHSVITRNLCEDLTKHKLLVPYHSQAQLSSGKKVNLGGFQIIDEKALSTLSDEVFLDFRKKGWLPFIYLALASAANWKGLVNTANLEGNSGAKAA